jgi:hypothetical protein
VPCVCLASWHVATATPPLTRPRHAPPNPSPHKETAPVVTCDMCAPWMPPCALRPPPCILASLVAHLLTTAHICVAALAPSVAHLPSMAAPWPCPLLAQGRLQSLAIGGGQQPELGGQGEPVSALLGALAALSHLTCLTSLTVDARELPDWEGGLGDRGALARDVLRALPPGLRKAGRYAGGRAGISGVQIATTNIPGNLLPDSLTPLHPTPLPPNSSPFPPLSMGIS